MLAVFLLRMRRSYFMLPDRGGPVKKGDPFLHPPDQPIVRCMTSSSVTEVEGHCCVTVGCYVQDRNRSRKIQYAVSQLQRRVDCGVYLPRMMVTSSHPGHRPSGRLCQLPARHALRLLHSTSKALRRSAIASFPQQLST